MKADIIIVGTGVSGLFFALNAPKNKKVLMLSKSGLDESDSNLAQGGICVLKNEDDYQAFFEDTMRAGHYENNPQAVEQMIRYSPQIIRDLEGIGVEFAQRDGKPLYTREGAHSTARILYHDDLTGKEITSKLLLQVKKQKHITVLEHTAMIDLICENNQCQGVVASDQNGEILSLEGNYIVLATGGLGGLFTHSTNYPHLTGDSLAVCLKHEIALENISYIQIHPTTLYSKETGRRFLISESVRGEGAVLLNKKGQRFASELLPRDLLTQAIYEEMEKDGQDHVWLSMKDLDGALVKKRFPNIYAHCLTKGIDVTKDLIPVTPAQHYFMGGIKVDLNSQTSMKRLLAVGEIACNGVHGANRLASNSLLESLVFSKIAARHVASHYQISDSHAKNIDGQSFLNLDKLKESYRKTILSEIERSRLNDIKHRSV
ncbi:L-aspartate oxidase [Eubacteriaceae bacterium ES2]|nr:L-aspartate oxidase [Eubacteriaceae bacterium ES2]